MDLLFPANPDVGLIYLNWRWDGAKWARMPDAAAGVASFNNRTGAVSFLSTDITAAGGALLAGPTFTGIPKAPTPTPGTNTTQLATTAFVSAAIVASTTGVASFNTRTGAVVLGSADLSAAGGALLSSPTFTGTPAAPTPTAGDNTTKLATTAFVAASFAPLASPALIGNPTAPTQAPGDNDTSLATTAFVTGGIATAIAPLAPTSSIPLASTTTPNMDGTAAIGGGTTWARADHVHPSDTSRLALSGGTLTGVLALAADPASALQAATKQYVDTGDMLALAGAYGGFVNKFRNETMDIWQRGVGPIAGSVGASIYGPDGWMFYSAGAAITCSRGGNLVNKSYYSMEILGASGVTDTIISQRIESAIAYQLANSNITVQARVFNQSGATITPQLRVAHPTTVDIAPYSNIDLAFTNLQPCSNNAYTTIAYTFSIPSASLAQGIQVDFDFGALNAAGKNVFISECDIRVTPNLPVGLCANPPPPELRPVAVELAFCQRYYQTGTTGMNTTGTAGQPIGYLQPFPVTMRAAPTIVYSGLTGGNITGSASNNGNRTTGLWTNVTATAAGYTWFQVNYTVNAEL